MAICRALGLLLLLGPAAETPGRAEASSLDWLNCDHDAAWRAFRLALSAWVEQVYGMQGRLGGLELTSDMVPSELVEMASLLVESLEPSMLYPQESGYMGYSEGMLEFLATYNNPESTQARQQAAPSFCLYGVVSALWVLGYAKIMTAVGGGAEQNREIAEQLLNHGKFLLGSHTRYCLDFMESSAWPITSLDLVVQNTRSVWRFPGSVPPDNLAASLTPYLLDPGGLPGRADRLRIWEIGVHASLSAEPLNLWAKLVFGRFRFANVIESQYPLWLPDKWSTLYGANFIREEDYEQGSPLLASLQALMRQRIPLSASSKEPVRDLSGFIAEFRQAVAAARQGSQPDVWLCTIFVLCLLPPPAAKLVGYFGHPMLFMVADDDRGFAYRAFAQMRSAAGGLGAQLLVSDPFLQMQYEWQTGARLPYARVHASYMPGDVGWVAPPRRPSDVLVVDRPFECVLMGVLQYFIDRWDVAEGGEDSGGSGPRSACGDASCGVGGTPDAPDPYAGKKWAAEGRLRMAKAGLGRRGTGTAERAGSDAKKQYPFRFVTRQLTDTRSYQEFSEFLAVVLLPYDMDLITFYEFYHLNIPMFLSSHLSKYMFSQGHLSYDVRFVSDERPAAADGARAGVGRAGLWPFPDGAGISPFQEDSVDAVFNIVKFVDYFKYPSVLYFASVPDLLHQLYYRYGPGSRSGADDEYKSLREVSLAMRRFNQKSLIQSVARWEAALKASIGSAEFESWRQPEY